MSMTISRYLLRKTMIAVLMGSVVLAGASLAEAKPAAHHHAVQPVAHVTATSAIAGFLSRIGGGGSSIVSIARSQIGNGAIYGRRNLWCARFMNWVLAKAGHKGTGSDMAESFAHVGTRVSGPAVGAIAVMGRRGGGHVGVVSGVDSAGNPIIISGNHAGRVRESVYPRRRIKVYVHL